MAGTISLSLSQQFDIYGDPLAGGQLYLIVAGTVSTPQNGYQDLALTVPLPNPITLDAAGRIPQFFLADGYIKVRLQDKHGVVQLASDNILVIGPSSGSGGGGATIDATTIFQTGDLKARYSTGVHPGASPGWVRANGLTIGSAASSPAATERGNTDCQALFLFLWPFSDPVVYGAAALTLSGTRTSAAADWASNKTITTPDWRGYSLGALDDMGTSTPSGRISTMGAAATTLGGFGGSQTNVILPANLPPYTPSGSIANGAIHSTFSPTPNLFGLLSVGAGGTSQFFGGSTFNSAGIGGSVSSPQDASSFTGNAQGGSSTPFGVVSPRKLCTFYIKL